uniref:Uncharacterized protein n=1 Tax=Panagrolaimus sp. JU765 TaxID=591449 RepID=A0AC34RCY6_9BILA
MSSEAKADEPELLQAAADDDNQIVRQYTTVQMDPFRGPTVFITFETKAQRKRFVRNVFCIVAGMLAFSVIAGILPFTDKRIKSFFLEYFWIAYICLAIYLITMILLSCVGKIRHKSPYNWICMIIISLSLNGCLMVVVSAYQLKSVGIALGVTVICVIVVSLYATFTKSDFTTCWALFWAILVLIIIQVVVLLLAIFVFPQYFEILDVIYSTIGAIICIIYLVVDIQMIMGNKREAFRPNDYIYGAVQLYTDIIMLFMYILRLTRNQD